MMRPQETSPWPSDGIVLGLTQDVVLSEIVELLRLKIVDILKIPRSAVQCGFSAENGKIFPEIQVSQTMAEGVSSDEIEEVIKSLWFGSPPVLPGIRDELRDRLADLRSTRGTEKAQA